MKYTLKLGNRVQTKKGRIKQPFLFISNIIIIYSLDKRHELLYIFPLISPLPH